MQTQASVKVAYQFLAHMKKLEQLQTWTNCDKNTNIGFMADVDGSFATKATMMFPLPFEKIFHFFADPHVLKLTTQEIQKSEVLESGNNMRLITQTFKMHGISTARDFTGVHSIHVDGHKVYIGTRSCDCGSDSVKAEMKAGGFLLECFGDEMTQVSMMFDIDFKGDLSKSTKKNIAAHRSINFVKSMGDIK